MPSTYQLTRLLLPLSLASTALALNPATYIGCFSSSTGLSDAGTFQYQSSGHCQQTCVDGQNNQAVFGMTGSNDCWCGPVMPPSSAQVSDSKCNLNCAGWPSDTCGGTNYWSVWLTGTVDQSSVQHAGGSAASSASSAASSPPSSTAAAATSAPTTTPADPVKAPTTTMIQPSVVTSVAPGMTVVVTESAAAATGSSAASSSDVTVNHKSSGPNIVGIVVGVVVGVAVLAAIAAAIFFIRRRKRRNHADEERKQVQAHDIAASGRPQIPATRRPLGPESRIDSDAMAQHRMSDGSIADNEDFSRRILQVTNPDNRQ